MKHEISVPIANPASGVRVDWSLAFKVATALVVLFTIQNYVAPPAQRVPASLGTAFIIQAVTWYTWLALLPIIVAAVRRFRESDRPLAGQVPEQLMAAAGVSLLHGAMAGLGRWMTGVSTADDVVVAVTNFPIVNFASGFIRYWLIAAAYHVTAYHQEVRAREVAAARLQANLAEAKLENLQGKLQPHFLFNTLNSVLALIREDPRAAEQMVENLGELLRASLSMASSREITLGQELALLEKYTAIERVRFQERLRVELEVPESVRLAHVPQLLLQPLVENAIRHGLAAHEDAGLVRITAQRRNGRLQIQVMDDGVGRGEGGAAGLGIGLGTTRERLRHLYGDQQRLAIEPANPRGTIVTVELPWRAENES
jgi:signal transduction histidine kinase